MDKRPIVSVEGASPRTTLLIERREDKTMNLQEYITLHDQLYGTLDNKYFTLKRRSSDNTKLHVYMTQLEYDQDYSELENLLEWHYHYTVDGLPIMEYESMRTYMIIKLYDKDYENYSEGSASPYFIYLHIQLANEIED